MQPFHSLHKGSVCSPRMFLNCLFICRVAEILNHRLLSLVAWSFALELLDALRSFTSRYNVVVMIVRSVVLLRCHCTLHFAHSAEPIGQQLKKMFRNVNGTIAKNKLSFVKVYYTSVNISLERNVHFWFNRF